MYPLTQYRLILFRQIRRRPASDLLTQLLQWHHHQGSLYRLQPHCKHTIAAFDSALPASAGSEASALVPTQLQQTLQRGMPTLSTSARLEQLHQVQADSSGSEQGQRPRARPSQLRTCGAACHAGSLRKRI